MATKLYARITSSSGCFTGRGLHVSPATPYDGWLSKFFRTTDGYLSANEFVLLPAIGSFATGTTLLTGYAGGTDKLLLMGGASQPLADDVTLSNGNGITFNFWGSEANLAHNLGFIARVLQLKPDGTLNLICNTSRGTELTTTNTVYNWFTGQAAMTLDAGDRILLLVGFESQGGSIPANAQATFRWSGPTGGADGDSWIEFVENMTFETTTAPAGTKFWLRDSTDDVPAVTGARDANRTQGSSIVSAVTDTVAGPTAGVQVTTTAGGEVREWFTPPLSGSASGLARVVIRGFQSSRASGRAAWRVRLAKAGRVDGALLSVIADDVLATQGLDGSVSPLIGEVDDVWDQLFGIPDTEFSGERLRITVYIDDSWGGYENGAGGTSAPMASGQTATFKYGGGAGSAGDSYVRFIQTLDDAPPLSPTDDMSSIAYFIPPARIG